jgi:hypothetical protein
LSLKVRVNHLMVSHYLDTLGSYLMQQKPPLQSQFMPKSMNEPVKSTTPLAFNNVKPVRAPEIKQKNENDLSDLLAKFNSNTSNNGLQMISKSVDQLKMASLYSQVGKQCQWPDCQNSYTKYESFDQYLKLHLSKEHRLDDKSHFDLIKQSNLIDKLEIELDKQKQVLNDMLFHLNSQLNIFKMNQQHQLQQQMLAQSQQPIMSHTANNQMFLAAMAAAAAAQSNNGASLVSRKMDENSCDANDMNEDENDEENNCGDDENDDMKNCESDENDSTSHFRRPFERSSLSLSVGMFHFFKFYFC